MHVERHGGPPDLQAAFTQFVVKVLRGRSLDDQRDVEARLGKFPDFACFRDLILLEMKHLEAEQTDRLNEVYQSKADPAEAPVFYGSRSIDKDLDKLSNVEEIRAAFSNKLSQTIETVLRKANSQFRDYRARKDRRCQEICDTTNDVLKVLQGGFEKLEADGWQIENLARAKETIDGASATAGAAR